MKRNNDELTAPLARGAWRLESSLGSAGSYFLFLPEDRAIATFMETPETKYTTISCAWYREEDGQVILTTLHASCGSWTRKCYRYRGGIHHWITPYVESQWRTIPESRIPAELMGRFRKVLDRQNFP